MNYSLVRQKINNKMGKSQSSSQLRSDIQLPLNCKIYSQLPLASPQDLEEMEQLLAKRSYIMKKCPYICSLASHQIFQQDRSPTDLSCRQKQKVVIFYHPFDHTLADIPIAHYTFSQKDIVHLINCICKALKFLYTHEIPYGDICAQNICFSEKVHRWMLVDKVFLKNGISAYEKVLEGEKGFITPKQMERIRHGFVRESPQITEFDDVFGLGMIVMQMGSRMDSNSCYRESHLRINQDILGRHLMKCSEIVSMDILRLIERMIAFDEDQRICIDEILQRLKTNSIPKNKSYFEPSPLHQYPQSYAQPYQVQSNYPKKLNMIHNTYKNNQDSHIRIMRHDERYYQTPIQNNYVPNQYIPRPTHRHHYQSYYDCPPISYHPHHNIPSKHTSSPHIVTQDRVMLNGEKSTKNSHSHLLYNPHPIPSTMSSSMIANPPMRR